MMRTTSTELPKPPIPYVKGWRFTVQSHTAPPPTPVVQRDFSYTKPEKKEQKQLSIAERCVRYPPLPGKAGSDTIELEVVYPLKVKDGTNAQVFIVKAIGPSPDSWPDQMVAKVYDPLYFEDEGCYSPFRYVDKHYTHEVNAYELLSEFQGDAIPRFYGSYSLDIPVQDLGVRTVRLILIENIPGRSMMDVSEQGFSQSTRQQFMKSVIDFSTAIYHRQDILNRDLSPRNIIIHPEGKVVFIDFADVLFNRKADDYWALRVDMLPGKYISPLILWKRDDCAMEFHDWVDWD